MKKHDRHHDHCEHDLAHCGKCDLAYCTKCSKEWGAECTQQHYPWYWGTISIPCDTTTTTAPYVTTSGTTDYTATHAHAN